MINIFDFVSKVFCKLGIHFWVGIDGDGQASYEQCYLCGKRRIFLFSKGEYIWRREWEKKRFHFFLRKGRNNKNEHID